MFLIVSEISSWLDLRHLSWMLNPACWIGYFPSISSRINLSTPVRCPQMKGLTFCPGPSSVLLSSCSLVPSINWVTPGYTPRYNPEVGVKLRLFHRRRLCDQPFFTYTWVTLSNIPTSHNNNIIQNNSSLTPTHYHRFLLSSHSFLSFCFIFILKLFPDPIVIM